MRSKITIQNYLMLDEELLNSTRLIVEAYFDSVDKALNSGKVETKLTADYLKIILEAIKYCEDREKWILNANNLLKVLKIQVEAGKQQFHIGLIEGWCDIALSIKRIEKKTGAFKRFLMSCNQYIVKVCESYCDFIKHEECNMKASYYDVVCGLSGVLIYFLEYEDISQFQKIIKKISEILIHIINGVHSVDGEIVVNYHIPSKNQVRIELMDVYPEGNINLGVAHGIISMGAALSRVVEKGILVEGIQEGIDHVIKIYEKFKGITEIGTVGWPEQVALTDFNNEKKSLWLSPRQSWCYGAIGICGTTLKIADRLERVKLAEQTYEYIKQIAILDINQYNLVSPIICHGYAGVLEIFIEAYKYKPDNIILNKIKDLVKILVTLYDKNSEYGYKDIVTTYRNGIYNIEYVDKNSFLEGSCGIVLVLLSAIQKDTEFGTYMLIR